MNCDLCEHEGKMGLPGGPMFCDMCLGAILWQLNNEGQLPRIMATIRARREQEKGTAQSSSINVRRGGMLKKDEEGER